MSKKRILVVDDSPTTCNLIKIQLQKLGYEVSAVASSANSALLKTKQTNPDLVLMDINLGDGMNGVQAADVIMQKYRKPVIYVTSYSDDETLESAKQSMPHGFINKPFRENDLRVNIEIALSRTVQQLDTAPSEHNDHCQRPTMESLELSPLSEVLDHLVSGVIVVDGELVVHYKNKSATGMLESRFPLRFQGDKLECSNPNTKRKIRQLINSKASTVLTVNHHDLEIHTLLFALGNPTRFKLSNTQASVMFLFTTSKDSQQIEDVVRTIYKLSPTEARLASMLVFNPYLSDIADSLGITYNTARTHLKRIYAKTDTNKLSALIQKIMTGPAGLLIHSTE